MKETTLKWKKIVVAQDEITRRERERANIKNSEQLKESAKLTSCDDFWDKISAYADECDNIIISEGFPHGFKLIEHDGAGRWWPIPEEKRSTKPKPGETRHFMAGYVFTQKHTPGFSDAWYAAEIGRNCRTALRHLNNGNAGTPYMHALIFEIATLRKDWQWRRDHKPSILTGRKQRGTLSEQREGANAQKKAEAEARRALIASMLDETSRTAGALERYLRERLEKDHHVFVSGRTIRRDLKEIRGA